VCGALVEAHGMGLIHRDIKPANVMLCRQGGEDDVVKLLDFGLVKDLGGGDGTLTLEGQLVGTPETMPPEVLAGGKPDHRSDLYSLGAVGWFLLTGRRLFDARNAVAMIHAHGFEVPPKPSALVQGVPADLEAVILRSLAKDPAARWPSAAAMREELLQCAEAGRWTAREAALWAAMPPVREAQPAPAGA
jgi:serine/threonine-protein kinase